MGTITFRKDRKKYVAKLEGRGAEKREFTTREKANDWVRHNESKVETRTYIRTGLAPPFGQASQDFLDDQQERVTLLGVMSQGTLENKIRYIKVLNSLHYGNERLADIPVSEIHAIGLKGCREHLLKTLKYSPKTVREIWMTFGQAFQFFMLNKWATANQPRILELPRVERGTKAYRLSNERAGLIVANAPDEWRLAIKFAMSTGLRAGEQRALTWKKLDFDRRVVTVDCAIDKLGKLKEAKTEAGMRSVTLTPDLIVDLRAWRLAQPIEQRANNLVFPRLDGRVAHSSLYRKVGLKKALKAAGIEDNITWHQLRHYYASVLIFQTKTPPERVSRLMGHTSFSFTLRTYGHWLDNQATDEAFSDELGAAFNL